MRFEHRHAAELLRNATRHCSNQQRAFLHTLVGRFGEGGKLLEFYIAHAAPPKEAGYTPRLEHGRDLKTALGGPPGPISRPLTTQTLKNSYFFIGRIGSPRTIQKTQTSKRAIAPDSSIIMVIHRSGDL